MKPLAIDFAPRCKLPHRTGWLAGGAGAVLVLAASIAWLPTSHVEASHMAAAQPQRLPGVETAQAVDAAVRELNLPWLGVLDALAASFGSATDAVLLQVEAEPRRAVVRLEGEARDAGLVQDIPARLRALPPVAEATLVGQELRAGTLVRPVRFVIELRLRDSP
ncbi:MAG: hypothetical protein Q8L56_12255 [Rhodocyclaceae bacterium]|nr:hypothetical protein [Rhodocyclaceae bacterium]